MIVASAGNFGQGVVYACRAFGVPAVVVAATTANPAKVEAMRLPVAGVRLVGEDFDVARTAAADLALVRPRIRPLGGASLEDAVSHDGLRQGL